MARTRRHKLARTLAEATDLTYQQALAWLEEHTPAGGRLPRTEIDLLAAYHAATSPPALPAALPAAPQATPEAGPETGTAPRRPVEPDTALVAAADVTSTGAFVIRSRSLGRCPGLVLSVAHWLPSGECAHAAPTCPTCQGRGQLATPTGPVTCGRDADLPTNVPVCDGTGTWTGQRT